MKKYVVLIVVSFILIAALAVGAYLWLNPRNGKTSDAIQAIPINASVIVKVDDFVRLKESINQNKVWESSLSVRGVSSISDVINFIDSLRNSNSSVRSLLSKNPLYASLCALGNGGSAYLFSIKLPEGVNPSDLYSLSKLQAIGLYRDEEKFYNRTSIITFKQENSEFASISVACHNGILLVGNSLVLLEESISQLDGDVSLQKNPQFVTIYKTSGSKVDANIYINLKFLPQILSSSLSETYLDGASTLSDIAQWIELDLNLSSNSLIMSGLSTVSDSTNSFLRILSGQKPVDIQMPSTLPVETGLLVWLGISDLDEYLEGYRSYLDRKNVIFDYTQNLSNCMNVLGMQVQDYFKSIIDEEVGVAFLPSNSSRPSDWYILARTKSASSTGQHLQDIASKYQKQKNQEGVNSQIAIKIDNQKSVTVYHYPIKGLHSLLLGSLFSTVSDEYYCFVDNWIVWGASPESLERYINANIHNNVLKNSNSFRQFSQQIPNKANYFIYINPSLIDKLAKEFLSADKTLREPLLGLQGISYELIGGNSLIFNTLTVTSGQEFASTTKSSVWETKLDAAPITKPFVVLNHTNREKEILIQDSDNNIYLINNIGRILWKRKVDGAIMGDVDQVDIFRNKKLQYAFNTALKLYVVDRNGKDVDGFPVLYAKAATNPVSVIDYDGNRDYRFFQACSDRKIYVYDIKGKPVKGWSFGKTETTITDRVGFVRSSGLDYLIVFDANRPYLLNRKGEERVHLKQYFAKAPNSTFSLGSDDGNLFIVTTDTIGLVHRIYLNGKVEDIALQSFSKWHGFIYQDLNGDGARDYVFSDNSTIYAFDSSQKLLFQLKVKDDIKPEILFFDFGGDNKIGVVSEKSNKIYLINSKGKLENSFPYAGSTSFSISRIAAKGNAMSLIVGSAQGTVVNYELK